MAAEQYFTEALAPAAPPLEGTERVALDLAAGGQSWASSALLAEAIPTAQEITDSTVGSFVALPEELAGARLCVLELMGTQTANATLTTPDSATLLALVPGGGFVGQSWVVRIINASSAAFQWTLAAGAGVTISGATVIAPGAWREWLVTNAAGGVEFQDIGAGASGSAVATASLVAGENLAAGAIVNLYSNAGSCEMRNANATDATKPAHGFVLTAVAAGASGNFYTEGQIDNSLSGLTPGDPYWLDTSAGGVTTAPPSGAGNLVQKVGIALSATELLVMIGVGVKL